MLDLSSVGPPICDQTNAVRIWHVDYQYKVVHVRTNAVRIWHMDYQYKVVHVRTYATMMWLTGITKKG